MAVTGNLSVIAEAHVIELYPMPLRGQQAELNLTEPKWAGLGAHDGDGVVHCLIELGGLGGRWWWYQ
jgi:hypothetical protein